MTTRLVLQLVADRLGEDGVAAVLRRADVQGQRDTLRSATGRVDHPTKLRLFAAAADVLGDDRFGLELGAAALRDPAFATVRALVRSAGSPQRALRLVSRASARLDSAAVLRCQDAAPGAASVVSRVSPPDHADRVDCDYTIGLLRQVPVLFGEAAAEVRHTECQVDSAPECVYELRWKRPWRTRWSRTQAPTGGEVAAGPIAPFEHRLAGLQSAAADLVGGGSLEDVLERIAARAGSAVHAPGHVLAVTLPSGRRHRRHVGAGTGLTGAVDELHAAGPGSHVVAGHPVLTVAVESAAQHHGYLSAVALPGQDFLPEDLGTLAAFAQHAAAGVEMAGHLERAREESRTARLLLAVASSLSRHRTVASVADAVAAAVPPLTGADRSAFALLDPDTHRATIAGMWGWPDRLTDEVARYTTDPQESPELCALLRSPAPVRLDATGSTWAREMLAAFDVEVMAAVPVVLEGEVLGLVLAHWVTGAPAVLDDVLTERLTGVAGLAAVALDNTRLLERVRRQATLDALTGVPNRVVLEDRLDAALEAARRDRSRVGVLFCDVDRFKRVNDSRGHEAGDQLLQHVAQALVASVAAPGTVARYSGDEFVVLLPDVASDSELRDVAGIIRARLAAPMTAAGEEVYISMAIGSALSDGWAAHDGDRRPKDAGSLVARARQDMYRLKARTRGLPAPVVDGMDRLRLETDLHDAASRNELVVHYQPQVDAGTGRTVAVEALVRWQHPTLGMVPPGVFIPIAEDSGAIGEIGAHVLAVACSTVAGWHVGGTPLELAVNVSASQLHTAGFSDFVRLVLKQTGLAAHRLVLEVTESQVVADTDALGELTALRALGVGISVDDFGTGYSSLSQLRRLPATEVKIDQSFTAELPGSASFVAGIVALAHSLDLRVVAEGVEQPEQLRALIDAGCDRAQGYLLGRPAPAADVRSRTDAAETEGPTHG
ncbi:EAL domain-containing protein [Cellulomonas aerilata]|uniref:EAL domain-containing protein n=1 Tax=Cellulomonas aerilata TaxID=515326 RepID=UPI001649E44F|nr:EAL domain-containing protein [Cellulomonas aerilata]